MYWRNISLTYLDNFEILLLAQLVFFRKCQVNCTDGLNRWLKGGPPEAVSPLEMFAVTFDRALNPFPIRFYSFTFRNSIILLVLLL